MRNPIIRDLALLSWMVKHRDFPPEKCFLQKRKYMQSGDWIGYQIKVFKVRFKVDLSRDLYKLLCWLERKLEG